MEILGTNKKDSELLASIVSKSNKDVAKFLRLNSSNAANHPSFCTSEWILSDIERGQEYFLLVENNTAKGCVAFEQAEEDTAYLNRLSVLPEFRNNGYGAALVKYVIDYSSEKKNKKISIGIIAEHTELKEWYLKKGFTLGALKQFDHLPFNVLYMSYELLKC